MIIEVLSLTVGLLALVAVLTLGCWRLVAVERLNENAPAGTTIAPRTAGIRSLDLYLAVSVGVLVLAMVSYMLAGLS